MLHFKRRKGNTLKLAQQNAVAMLNELRPSLKYNIIETTGPGHAPIFKISVEVDGQEYIGVGGSKKAAKCKAAELALKSFIQFPNNCKVVQRPESVSPNADFTSDSFEVSEEKKQKIISNKRTASNPVQLLNELYPNTKYECIPNANKHEVYARYKVVVNVKGDTFFGTGKNVSL